MRKAIWAFAGVIIVLAMILLHGAIHMKMDKRMDMREAGIAKHHGRIDAKRNKMRHGQISHHVHSEDGQILWQANKKKDDPEE
tara:strand:+ start:438 stop:686 length:249 start_codon:yes stop_codon:yes gene_type:complete